MAAIISFKLISYCLRYGFFKEAVEKEEKFENLLSKKGERKLTSKQVLKILKEEAEFDKKFKKVSLSRKNHKKTNNNSELKDKELSFMELLGSKEFWFGFSISVAFSGFANSENPGYISRSI